MLDTVLGGLRGQNMNAKYKSAFPVNSLRFKVDDNLKVPLLIKMNIIILMIKMFIILETLVYFIFFGVYCNLEVTYKEIEELEAACNPLDRCLKNRTTDQLDIYNCNCDNSCVEFDTCCLESKFRTSDSSNVPRSDMKCLRVYGSEGLEVYMIDTCKNNHTDTKSLCESNGEDINDPFLMIPVTSPATGKTYKNYFCSVCNENIEDQDQVIFWNLQLRGKSPSLDSSSVPDLKYDPIAKSWVVLQNDNTTVNVSISLYIADGAYSRVKMCKAGMISNCSVDWQDASIEKKCASYMAAVGYYTINGWRWYRNPHCAFCNFEDTKFRKCAPFRFRTKWTFIDKTMFVGLFVLKDESKSCGSKMVYDKFAKKCRCNARDSLMKDGKCVSKT
ncbi:uncharacterized protein CDAR_274641 [Caerostris darwini]|uniref:SMB domain-containing protein n=1 Tax=Caerostris darwini TaxID=1538125 RepID=A0AAV4QHS5_9ARAC|nr:uncharacterized protein CDAR_274641 [Caerostris darwini]